MGLCRKIIKRHYNEIHVGDKMITRFPFGKDILVFTIEKYVLRKYSGVDRIAMVSEIISILQKVLLGELTEDEAKSMLHEYLTMFLGDVMTEDEIREAVKEIFKAFKIQQTRFKTRKRGTGGIISIS